MKKNQMEAAEAYYKAMYEEKNFSALTNRQVAEALTKRLGFKVSETAARNIRVNLGLPTKKQVKVEVKTSGGDTNDAIKTLAKTQNELTHIVISMLNRSPGHHQTSKEPMLHNLDSIAKQTEEIARTSTRKRKPSILPVGYAIKLARRMRIENAPDSAIILSLKNKYIEAGVEGAIALRKAENLVKYKLDKKKK